MDYWSESEAKDATNRGVNILYHCTNLEVTNNRSLPINSYVVGVKYNGQEFQDIVQGSLTNTFDVYYDKFGKMSIVSIRNTAGQVNPKVYGFKPVDKKRRNS